MVIKLIKWSQWTKGSWDFLLESLVLQETYKRKPLKFSLYVNQSCFLHIIGYVIMNGQKLSTAQCTKIS